MSFSVGSVLKHPMQEMWVWSLGQEDTLEKGMATPPVFLSGEPHGQRSLVGYSPWGRKELDTIEQASTHYLIYGKDDGAVSAMIRYVTQSSLVDSLKNILLLSLNFVIGPQG